MQLIQIMSISTASRIPQPKQAAMQPIGLMGQQPLRNGFAPVRQAFTVSYAERLRYVTFLFQRLGFSGLDGL